MPKSSRSSSSRKSTESSQPEDKTVLKIRPQKPKVEEVVEQPELVETPETEAPLLEDTPEHLLELISLKNRQVRDITSEVHQLNKRLRVSLKKLKRTKTKNTTKVERHFKTRPVVDSVCELMGVESGSEFTRIDVQKFICAYVKEHNLQYEDDKRTFKTDDKLFKVLGEPRYRANAKNDQIRHSYTNIMKVYSSLFIDN